MQNYETDAAVNFPQPTHNQALDIASQELSPDNPPWNWGLALVVWFASVAFIVIIPGIAILIYVANKHYNLTDSNQLAEAIQRDPSAILVNILAVIPAHLLTIAVAWAVVTNLNKFSFTEMLGWRWGGFKFWHPILILLGFFVLAYFLTLIFGDQDNELLRILRSSRAIVYAVAFMATFTAPLVEEVVYRGVLFSALQKDFKVPIRTFLAGFKTMQRLKRVIQKINLDNQINKLLSSFEDFQQKYSLQLAITIVTLIFAFVHVPQYYPSIATIISICVLSLVLTLIRAKTKNLLPCIVLHTVFNGIQAAGLIAEPWLKHLTDQTQPAAIAFILHLFK